MFAATLLLLSWALNVQITEINMREALWFYNIKKLLTTMLVCVLLIFLYAKIREC